MIWYKIADEKHMTLQRCQREMTSSEFVMWKVRLEQKVNEFHREDYFLAQIAYMILLVNAGKDAKIDFEKFLLKFNTGKDDDDDTQDITSRLSPEEKVKRSMSIWGSFLGLPDEPD